MIRMSTEFSVREILVGVKSVRSPWKYGAAESMLMEWSFGASWIDDLFKLDDDDNSLALFLTEILSTAELELELDACNWFDFEVSENVEFGFFMKQIRKIAIFRTSSIECECGFKKIWFIPHQNTHEVTITTPWSLFQTITKNISYGWY